MEKKTWKKPKLIVMLRTKTEENVLVGCKTKTSFKSTSVSGGGGIACAYCYKNHCPVWGAATS